MTETKENVKEIIKSRKKKGAKGKKWEIGHETLQKLSMYERGMAPNDPPLLLNLRDSDKEGEDDVIMTEDGSKKNSSKKKTKKTLQEKLEGKLLPVKEGPTLKELKKKVGAR